MTDGDTPGYLRLLLGGLIVFGLLAGGTMFVFWGWFVLPWLAVVGAIALLVRWLRGGGEAD